MTTASRSPGFTTSRSGGAPIGRCTAARNAACSSGSPGTKRGSMTVTLSRDLCRETVAAVCRCTFIAHALRRRRRGVNRRCRPTRSPSRARRRTRRRRWRFCGAGRPRAGPSPGGNGQMNAQTGSPSPRRACWPPPLSPPRRPRRRRGPTSGPASSRTASCARSSSPAATTTTGARRRHCCGSCSSTAAGSTCAWWRSRTGSRRARSRRTRGHLRLLRPPLRARHRGGARRFRALREGARRRARRGLRLSGLDVLADRHVRTGIAEAPWGEHGQMVGGYWPAPEGAVPRCTPLVRGEAARPRAPGDARLPGALRRDRAALCRASASCPRRTCWRRRRSSW